MSQYITVRLLFLGWNLFGYIIQCVCVVVVYGCETWSPTLRDERRLTVFENWMLRRKFGPKRNEVTGEWRKLHNDELYDM